MRIEVLHLIWRHSGVFQGGLHGAARTVHVRRRHVTGVSTAAVADQFGIHARAARFGVFVFFQHHDAGAFAQHKTVAVFVPRAGCGFRVVVAGGQGAHGGKTAQSQR